MEWWLRSDRAGLWAAGPGARVPRGGPAVLPGCPAARLGPAAPRSPKPGNKGPGSVLFSYVGAPHPPQTRGPSTLDSLAPPEQQHLRGFVVAVPCSLMHSRVPFGERGLILQTPPPPQGPVGTSGPRAQAPSPHPLVEQTQTKQQAPALSWASMWVHMRRCSRQSQCLVCTATCRGVLQI